MDPCPFCGAPLSKYAVEKGLCFKCGNSLDRPVPVDLYDEEEEAVIPDEQKTRGVRINTSWLGFILFFTGLLVLLVGTLGCIRLTSWVSVSDQFITFLCLELVVVFFGGTLLGISEIIRLLYQLNEKNGRL